MFVSSFYRAPRGLYRQQIAPSLYIVLVPTDWIQSKKILILPAPYNPTPTHTRSTLSQITPSPKQVSHPTASMKDLQFGIRKIDLRVKSYYSNANAKARPMAACMRFRLPLRRQFQHRWRPDHFNTLKHRHCSTHSAPSATTPPSPSPSKGGRGGFWLGVLGASIGGFCAVDYAQQ